MKIISSDFKKGIVKIETENLDDLWYLSTLVDPGDIISGKTARKVKIGEGTERTQKVTKKTITLEINVEKTEFSTTKDVLRISGTVTTGTDDVPSGTYHSFNIEQHTTLTIQKTSWLSYHKERLKTATEASKAKILLCLFDREDALFAISKQDGYEVLSSLRAEAQKKEERAQYKGEIYEDITRMLEEYLKRYEPTKIIVASPAFWTEELLKRITNQELKQHILSTTCSAVNKTAISEVLKQPTVKKALKQDRTTQEVNYVEKIFTAIATSQPHVYGIEQTEEAANAGAIELLLVTDTLIQQTREENTYDKLENIMKAAEKSGGQIHIISAAHEAGSRLQGIGGIAATLRYAIN